MSRKRNGTIDLLRFIFCLVVLLFHITNDIHSVGKNGGVFRLGGLSVEFFFIVSGYYMASSVFRQKEEKTSISVWMFILNKIKPILPYHIVFNAVIILGSIIVNHRGLEEVLNKMTSFFFLPVVGFNNYEWALGAEWYIGFMLFAMIIIYPIFNKCPNFVTAYIAPVASIVLVGYLSTHYSSIIDADRMVRAFAGILLGITAFGLVKKLEVIKNDRFFMIIKLYPAVILVLFLFYMNTTLDNSIQSIAILLMWSALIPIFAEKSIITKSRFLNHEFVYFLGKISVPIYLIQNITRNFCGVILHGFGNNLYPLVACATTIVLGIICYYSNMFIHTIITNRKKNGLFLYK